MKVLEHQDDDPVLGEPLHQAPGGPEDLEAHRLPVEESDAVLQAGLNGQPEHHRQVRQEVVDLVADRVGELPPEHLVRLGGRRLLGDPDPAPEEVEERPVAERLAE